MRGMNNIKFITQCYYINIIVSCYNLLYLVITFYFQFGTMNSLCFSVIHSGSLGQLGVEVARFLRGIYGRENVIMSDIIKPSKAIFNEGLYTWTLR